LLGATRGVLPTRTVLFDVDLFLADLFVDGFLVGLRVFFEADTGVLMTFPVSRAATSPDRVFLSDTPPGPATATLDAAPNFCSSGLRDGYD